MVFTALIVNCPQSNLKTALIVAAWDNRDWTMQDHAEDIQLYGRCAGRREAACHLFNGTFGLYSFDKNLFFPEKSSCQMRLVMVIYCLLGYQSDGSSQMREIPVKAAQTPEKA